MKFGSKAFLRVTAAATAALAMGGVAQSATIKLFDQGGVTGSQAEMGFKIAAAYWGSVLSNNVTINMGVGFSSLGAGVIGSTGSSGQDFTVANWETRVNATKSTSTLDQAVVLPTLNNGAISMITSGPQTGNLGVNTNNLVWDTSSTGNASINNKTLYMNTAVVKAIGGTATYDATNTDKLDGETTFSSDFAFDFDPTDGIEANHMDFIGVAIHEIGHALGFVSGVDYYDYYGRPNGPGKASAATTNFNTTSWFSALDMFRYSTDVNNVAPGANPVLDLSVARPTTIALGGNPYFSIDGGLTQLFGDSRFATGTYNGDGDQASHWKDATGLNSCGPQVGIMDPTFCYAQMGEITSLDLAAYDAMGWNISFDVLGNPTYRFTTADAYRQFATSVPEPASWAMMIGGFGLIGGSLRSRRSIKVSFA